MKILELFAGIGACSKALTNLGIEHEIVDAVEIDKYAIKSFNAIHGTNFEPQDITKWDKNVECDLIMHGSPCQDFSIAGKQQGGDEGSGTRSSLLYETIRIVAKLKPKYVIWENVKNVISKKHRHNFDNYLEQMENLGYTNYYQVLNAKDYGIPQNRERVFTISILGEHNLFIFPPKQELTLRLKDILEDEVDEKYYLSNKMIDYVLASGTKTFYYKPGIDLEIARPLNATMVKMHRSGIDNYVSDKCIQIGNIPKEVLNDNERQRRIYSVDGLSTTILGRTDNCKIENNLRIRKLTPKECWRLMGFDDTDFDKSQKVNSNTQLYKQAGNSIVVNVLMAILKSLLEREE